MAPCDGLAGAIATLERDDLRAWMAGQEAHELTAAVAGGADDPDPYRLSHGRRL
jgi:hypothetical protein